ncbi:hypothetical protein CPB85DRAFT_396594 [Mucidula mucida]|nr:hypothetical protein CPB85DRAFT_396594 [Mucidula mucida]
MPSIHRVDALRLVSNANPRKWCLSSLPQAVSGYDSGQEATHGCRTHRARTPSQSEEQVFLQRLMTLSWVPSESGDEQETRETAIAETETWLSSQADDQATELRGALNALKEHRKNVNRRRQAETKVREIEARAVISESENEALQARLTQMTTELEELRVQMRTVEENAAAAAVTQKKSRKGKEKEVISHNPLPLPPEDISNRYGDFSRRALQDIPLTQTELNTPIPYPPQLNLPPIDFPPTQLKTPHNLPRSTTLFPAHLQRQVYR